ncbi:hypothetical protein AYI70_g3777, partial [Smittium culicis]
MRLFFIYIFSLTKSGDRPQPSQAQILNSGSKQEPNPASKPPL